MRHGPSLLLTLFLLLPVVAIVAAVAWGYKIFDHDGYIVLLHSADRFWTALWNWFTSTTDPVWHFLVGIVVFLVLLVLGTLWFCYVLLIPVLWGAVHLVIGTGREWWALAHVSSGAAVVVTLLALIPAALGAFIVFSMGRALLPPVFRGISWLAYLWYRNEDRETSPVQPNQRSPSRTPISGTTNDGEQAQREARVSTPSPKAAPGQAGWVEGPWAEAAREIIRRKAARGLFPPEPLPFSEYLRVLSLAWIELTKLDETLDHAQGEIPWNLPGNEVEAAFYKAAVDILTETPIRRFTEGEFVPVGVYGPCDVMQDGELLYTSYAGDWKGLAGRIRTRMAEQSEGGTMTDDLSAQRDVVFRELVAKILERVPGLAVWPAEKIAQKGWLSAAARRIAVEQATKRTQAGTEYLKATSQQLAEAKVLLDRLQDLVEAQNDWTARVETKQLERQLATQKLKTEIAGQRADQASHAAREAQFAGGNQKARTRRESEDFARQMFESARDMREVADAKKKLIEQNPEDAEEIESLAEHYRQKILERRG